MPKVSNLVEFTDKEIRDLLHDKAKQLVGKDMPAGASSVIEITYVESKEHKTVFEAKVTFNGKAKD